jgi:hypothetical protein
MSDSPNSDPFCLARSTQVCVIGAGVSGLTACKALADFGVPHICFEASDEVGGNWYFQNPNGTSSAYRSLHIDISKPSISFRDFPMPDRYPDYPHHTHIFEWLRDYADAFGLRDRIRFNTRVQRAERGPGGGGWQVTLEDGERVSSELLGRLGAGDAVAKGDVTELLGDRVRFTDGSVEPFDAIVYATGYKISFPFFDPEFLSAPENVLPLYKRMLKPGLDDLAFIGLGQPIPTIFPFSELQSKLAARWLSGDWAPPPQDEMEAEIVRDEAFHIGHFISKPRHTMQLEWYAFQHELLTRSIPAGQLRARTGAPTGRDTAGRTEMLEGSEIPA